MVEKMETKHQKKPKQGGKLNKKVKKRSGAEEGGRMHLDALTVGYFRRVSDRLEEGFTEEEEKFLFVDNVLREVKGQAATVAMDMTGSVAFQKMLPLASPAQVGEVLSELGGEDGSAFRAVSCDRCGGHVMESALRQVARWTEPSSHEENQTETTESVEQSETEDCGLLEAQVLVMSGVVRDHILEFIKHTHGSHVVRTLIHVLGGCLDPGRTDSRTGGKEKNVKPLLTDFEAPVSFWMELKTLSSSLMENVNVCVTDTNASHVLQILLTICHRKRPKLCKQLTKGIMKYLSSVGSAPGVSPLFVFFKDQASSHLLETVIQISHKALLRDLCKNHLKDQLVNLALHPIANFPIQKLIKASTKLKMFPKVFDELLEGLEAILAAGHMGVVVQLAESCVEREDRQTEMLQQLLQAFHCAEPSSRHSSCLPLLLSLYAYEVYYNSEAAEGDTASQRPLDGICYHGSCLVQSLAKYKDRSLLMNSVHSLSPSQLVTLGTDKLGSHALQALVTSASDKGKGKFLRKMEGQHVQLACSKYGSRFIEAVWNSATVSQKQSIAQELVSSEAQLRSDQFARHVWAKFALTHFAKRKAQWQEVHTGQAKKKKLFNDILK
ncbi:nucleolar protein 9 isoform X2 [Denticeps clupeoides]|uniref:Nucleolar protein 9 n=1 Tax=Denticeps clupeoides TaxID=299321 RepID=A0AAY4AMP8_9TELE|nr:nucleolar protein 9 isoform X2 [Denticeps clupeoides]